MPSTEKAEAVISAQPGFKTDYKVWYSETLTVLEPSLEG